LDSFKYFFPLPDVFYLVGGGDVLYSVILHSGKSSINVHRCSAFYDMILKYEVSLPGLAVLELGLSQQ
jgi:hypothetical protein